MKHRYRATIYVMALCSLYGSANAQTAAPASTAIVDTDKCEVSHDPLRFDRKLLRLHVYLSRGFEDSTLHDPSCPEEALINMGDPSSWLTEIWAEFADKDVAWEQVGGFAPLVDDEQLRKFRTLLGERSRVHQMTAATMIGTFFAGKAKEPNSDKQAALRGYGHMGCCSLFVISRIESVDTDYASGLNYSSEDWLVDMPEDCGSERMLGLPANAAIRSWQKEANEGRTNWHDDPRATAEYQLEQLRSGPLADRSAGTVQRVETGKKESEVKAPVAQLPTETLLDLPSTPYLRRYQWIEADHVTRYIIAVSRPYWLIEDARSPEKVIWAPVASSVLQCAAL